MTAAAEAAPQSAATAPREGGCDCRRIRYRLTDAPLIVHCCHCRWCQRESGASFALNAMIEADRVELLGDEPEFVPTPSASGRGQLIARCPDCRVALWSHYAGNGPFMRFVRVGTLDDPDALPPDVHIFTASKQPWVVLSPDTPAFAEYYERERIWRPESLARCAALLRLIRLDLRQQRQG
ncbi:MAG TPA: GFA family protein [Tahibacter sp.]|nr:GFA family protein [Tahibacter sp.]